MRDTSSRTTLQCFDLLALTALRRRKISDCVRLRVFRFLNENDTDDGICGGHEQPKKRSNVSTAVQGYIEDDMGPHVK